MTEPVPFTAVHAVPEHVLARADVRAALAQRDFGTFFALTRKWSGISYMRIADACDMKPERVGKLARGEGRVTSVEKMEQIADGLRVPGAVIGLAPRPWEGAAPLAAPTVPVKPRAGGSVGPVSGTDLDSVLAVANGRKLSPATLRALHSSIEDYWRRDDEHGGETLRPAVVGQLRYVLELMRGVGESAHRLGLCAVAAELARLTGWTYFDARQYSQARVYFTEALHTAQTIGDRLFMANALACMSLQATYEDRPRDAVALAAAAQDNARGNGGTPRVMSMLSMREAFAHASADDPTSARSAIAEAHNQFEQVSADDVDPAWVAYFDEPKLIVDTGIVHSRMGDITAAEPLITAALRRDVSSNHRGRAFRTFWLAKTQLQRGDVEQACQTATGALEAASFVGSERVMGHLREFHQQLAPYSKEPEATTFSERLRDALL
ncbi:hypothetical protein AB0F13_23260 [Streptomyces sp. NPDC026206]|uniref:hypothetical protein n=1 Tax=Streptomyces sp. NPDC026206 TaxID=3157089 RepID=UPI0033E1F67F